MAQRKKFSISGDKPVVDVSTFSNVSSKKKSQIVSTTTPTSLSQSTQTTQQKVKQGKTSYRNPGENFLERYFLTDAEENIDTFLNGVGPEKSPKLTRGDWSNISPSSFIVDYKFRKSKVEVSSQNLRIHAHFLMEIKHTGALEINQAGIKKAVEAALPWIPGNAYVHVKTIPSQYKNALEYLATGNEREQDQLIEKLSKIKIEDE